MAACEFRYQTDEQVFRHHVVWPGLASVLVCYLFPVDAKTKPMRLRAG